MNLYEFVCIIQVRRSARLKCDRFIGSGLMKENLQMCKSNSAGSSENFKNADTCKVIMKNDATIAILQGYYRCTRLRYRYVGGKLPV